ncbi:CHAT domain-containing protein [Actinokineospora alba]|uniref:CHAT domain-containing protein n=1 Tax=Actinokineospora alba TaxID=504798 RepID=A0A1H0GKS3_9PSEU|nr:CHAT domain-containing protein [Actinokineospora alba]TDP69939.1 CHAT domain-containing protein [Actinokineospora alba]SDI05507.1 CHAT domain-containing protein [Actinokineospora alba]SDO07547.1 CHAT domain-containing protein [Actinokineospora alba]
MAGEYADLEFGLVYDSEQDAFDVSLRYTGVDTVDWPEHPPDLLRIDLPALADLVDDDDAYAEALTRMVFGNSEIARFYEKAMAAAHTAAVHVRLHVDGPSRFHSVRWELLRDPVSNHPIATNSTVLFSRYLSSADWRPIPVRKASEQVALVVVAAPNDVGEYAPGGRDLAPVNLTAELDRARDALKGYRAEFIGGNGTATLAAITARLRDRDDPIDVLYLVAHGALTEDVPLLFLEAADGKADPVDARRLVESFQHLETKPMLAVLMSCRSAGTGTASDDGGALAGLGPRLAGAGIAAVIAMQGDVTMTTAQTFAEKFFAEFADDGVVDRAVAIARAAVRDRPDWWVPVLFSRLRSGRTYYRTEVGRETWSSLALMMRTGRFTPVLGPGFADGIVGSRVEIARRWARRWQMPIAPSGKGNFAQVAQYLRVGRSPGEVRAFLLDYLMSDLREKRRRAGGHELIAEVPRHLLEGSDPEPVILELGRLLRERDPDEPYRAAASLPVKVYVTTGWTDLLQQALRANEQPKDPVTLCFPWNDTVEQVDPHTLEPPTVAKPWVYHLFGRLDNPDSVVLTEDDHFEWLTAWIEQRPSIPPAVSASLMKNSLMFLGYRLDDWDFRVVFQGIKSFGGSSRLRANTHVGVQVRPESQTIEPEAAQRYLESYFGEDRVSLFWSATKDFLRELRANAGGDAP